MHHHNKDRGQWIVWESSTEYRISLFCHKRLSILSAYRVTTLRYICMFNQAKRKAKEVATSTRQKTLLICIINLRRLFLIHGAWGNIKEVVWPNNWRVSIDTTFQSSVLSEVHVNVNKWKLTEINCRGCLLLSTEKFGEWASVYSPEGIVKQKWERIMWQIFADAKRQRRRWRGSIIFRKDDSFYVENLVTNLKSMAIKT